jgi:hypothetical protein
MQITGTDTRVLNRVGLGLTETEARELRDTLTTLLEDSGNRHEHVSSSDYQRRANGLARLRLSQVTFPPCCTEPADLLAGRHARNGIAAHASPPKRGDDRHDSHHRKGDSPQGRPGLLV